MFDHDADRMRGAGLTAFNPLAEPKARGPVSPAYLAAFEFLLRKQRDELIRPPLCLPAPTGPTGATGCLSSPEYPKGMNGPTGQPPAQDWREITRIAPPPSDPKAMDLFAITAHPTLKNESAAINPSHIAYMSEDKGKSSFWPLFEIATKEVKLMSDGQRWIPIDD